MPTTTIRFFAYAHLPEALQAVSKPIGELATLFEASLPDGPEKSAGMRKLLEAKDCFVRAALPEAPKRAPDGPLPRERLVLSFKETNLNQVRYVSQPAGRVIVSAGTAYDVAKMEHVRGVVYDVPAGAEPSVEWLASFEGDRPQVSDRKTVK